MECLSGCDMWSTLGGGGVWVISAVPFKLIKCFEV